MEELKQLETLLSRGKITRREFLAKTSALGLTALAAASLPGVPALAATPKKGGRFRVGVPAGATSDSLDPVNMSGMMRTFIGFGQLYNCLVEIDHKNNAVSELAQTWEASSDAKQWIFRLCKGVEFHNGKLLDAEDVIFSLNRHRGEKSKSWAKGLLKQIRDIRADGKHTLVFTLEDSNVDFPYILSSYPLGIIPSGTADFEKGIGTGGYMLTSFTPGVRCLTKRNPNYWKQGRAHFDEVETIHLSDTAARTNALRTDATDYMARCDYKTAGLLGKLPGIQVISKTGGGYVVLPMQTDIPPYDRNEVRLALKYAIDREQMVSHILHGHGTPGNDHPIAPSMRFFASGLEQRRYDPDKARHLMKKAGLAGHTFRFHVADIDFPGVDTAVLYKEQAAKAGIRIEVMKEPEDGYWSNVWGKRPWFFSNWHGRPTEDLALSLGYAENSAWNETHFRHERFNALLRASRGEFKDVMRREMYAEMQRILRDEGGALVPFFPNILDAAATKVKFENFASNYKALDGCKAAERLWFES